MESYLLYPMRWLDFTGTNLGTKEKVPRIALCHLTWGIIPTSNFAVSVIQSSPSEKMIFGVVANTVSIQNAYILSTYIFQIAIHADALTCLFAECFLIAPPRGIDNSFLYLAQRIRFRKH